MNILKKQIPLRYLYLIGVLVLILISLGLYVTYAMFTADINDDKVLSIESNVTYDFGINGTQSFNVGAHTNVLFNANIINNSENEVYYEIYYTSNDNLTDTIIAELVEDTSSTTSAPNTSGNLTNGSNKTVYIGLINTGDTSVNVTIGVVNTSVGDSITYGSNNYPSGYKITTVYNISEVSDSCNAKNCITRIENGEEKTYCPVSDYSDIIVKSNIGNFRRGIYNVSTSCTNAESSFNNKNWEFRIKNLTGYSTCNATFTEDTNTYPKLYDKIISLWNNTDGTNNIFKEDHTFDDGETYTEYRYEGTDTEVNNYVWFNNELWRIIGAFPGGTPTTSETSLGNRAPSTNNTVKIIRNDAIGSFTWDKDKTNNWTTAELNTNILNNLYLNSTSGTCNYYSTGVTKPCDFTDIGLKNVLDYIETATWNLGGGTVSNAETMYKNERGTTVYNSRRSVVTTAKVGLMYISDYGYSVKNASCNHSSKSLGSYNATACGGSAWILKNGYEWTMSPHSSYNTVVFTVSSSAVAGDGGADYGFGVRPVLYLNSNVYYLRGTGTKTDPFQIALGN
ncbi:MAG: hypothetical protein ACI312_00330 [Bacilli bacterium]